MLPLIIFVALFFGLMVLTFSKETNASEYSTFGRGIRRMEY